jgi:flagellar motor switch protein FliG
MRTRDLKELVKRASRGAGAARDLYEKLSRAQKVSLFLVSGLVALALSSVALSGSESTHRALATEEAGSATRRLDDIGARLTRESIPWRERAAPGGGRAIEVPSASYRRARALLDEPDGAAPSGPEWPFESSSFWESESKFGEKLRDFDRQRIEQAILWNPKVQDATVVLSRAPGPRHARERAGGDSASVTVQLKSDSAELLEKEADAIRAMVRSAFDLRPERVSITDNLFRSYGAPGGGGAPASGVEEAGDRWRRRIKEDITEHYANIFAADEFHVGVIVHVSPEQSSIVSEEFDPEKSISKPTSTKLERELVGAGDSPNGGLMSPSIAGAAVSPRTLVRESTEEETWVGRKQTVTQIPAGVLRGASVSVLVDLAAVERLLRKEEEVLRRPAAPGSAGAAAWSLASIPPDEREALVGGFVEREEEVLRNLLSTAGESNVKVIVGAFGKSGRERIADVVAPATLAAAPPGSTAAPRPGGWATALVGAGIIACIAACALALARRAARRSAAGDAPDEPAAGDGAISNGRRLGRLPGSAGILRTVSDTSATVRQRPEVAASVLRFWLSQDAADAGGAAAGSAHEKEGTAAAPAADDPGIEAPRSDEPGTAPPAGGAVRSLTGARKAAVFILYLEEEVASLLLRALSDSDLARITTEIAGLGVVDRDTVAQVIREFTELERLHGMVREGGLDHAIRLVERSFPREKARRIVDLLSEHRQTFPFSFLEEVEVETLMSCLADEHPQTLAVVFAHMLPAKAAEIVERLDPALRRDVLERIAGLEGANAEALEDLERSLRKHLDAVRFEALGEGGGVKALAEILRAADGEGRALLDDLRQGRPDLAEEVGRHLFVFDDIVRLDDRALQAVLKEIDAHRLALSLKNASQAIRAKVLDNVSRRTAEILEEEMDVLGPVRFADVDAARQGILETVLRLEESGQLYISGRGREENRIVY